MDCTFYNYEEQMWVVAQYNECVPYNRFVYIQGESVDGEDGTIVNKKRCYIQKNYL